jgi:aspartate/methionine/tyrosine aminotransferase
LGSTCCLNNWAFSLFKRGDKVGIDTPFYFFFKHDFAKSEIILSYRSICSGTLLERVRHSYGAGEKGYIIVSPHNPTGIIIDAQEIAEVC